MAVRALILLAGPPGTGKTHLMHLIEDRFGDFDEVSFDDLKEAIYEEQGFVDQAAKDTLYPLAQQRFFDAMAASMAQGRNVISDYPFSDKQRSTLEQLCVEYGYTPLTVRLSADFEVLFGRQRARDLDPSRHPAHLVDSYRPGQKLRADQREAAALSREEFYRRCTTRGYDTFQLGGLITLDTTDFAKVDYPAVLDSIADHYR